MMGLFQAYQLTLVFGFFVLASVTVYAWKRRDQTGAKSFLVWLVGEEIWLIAAFLAVHHRGTPKAVHYSKFWFPGVNLVVIGVFLLALEYTGNGKYITIRLLALLSIEPIVFNAIVWLNEPLVWERGNASTETMRGFVMHQGPAFAVHTVYSYALLAAATIMIAHLAFGSNRLYRRQAIAILIIMYISGTGNILYILDIVSVDTTPFAFAINGTVLGLAIHSVKLLDITPVARDSLVETIHDGVFVLDQDARVVDVNERGREILGPDTEREIGDPIKQFADECVPVSELLDLHRETANDTIGLTIDGRYYTAQTTPLHGIRGEFVGSVFLLHDITEQKRRQDRLRRKNEKLDKFASVVSHDLRNPLNVAAGYVELARETQDDEYFDRIDTAHERMETLIEDLLALARENDQISEPESVSLSSIARNAWENVQIEEATLDVGDTTLLADPDRLQQLFENLFRNAIEHGGTDISVTVGSFDGDGFFVEDDGPGIDPDMRERILETGVTTAEDGTGLGLAIVQNVVEAHGWILDVTESDDGGARFEIRGVAVGD